MRKSAYTKPLILEHLRMWVDLLSIKDWRKGVKLEKMSKKLSLEESRIKYEQKFVFSDNLEQNMWNKVKKSIKTGRGSKSLISTFASFLTVIAKVLFLKERLDTGLCLYPNLRVLQ